MALTIHRGLGGLLAGLALFVSLPRAALACGGSGPGGTGACPFPTNKRVIHLGASLGTSWSRISFGSGRKVDTRRTVAYASLATSLGTRTLIEFAVGGLLPGGTLSGATRADLGPGAALAVTFAWRVFEARGARPFLTFTGTLSGLAATTRLATGEHVPYGALDARLGANAGYTLWDTVRPYAVGRVFGGPVLWKYVDATGAGERVQGTDIYKYQVGGGVAWRLPEGFDAFVEGVGFGERGLFVGVGRAF